MRSRADHRARTRIAVTLALLAVALLAAWRVGLFGIHDRERLRLAIAAARRQSHLVPAFIATYAVAAAVGVPVTPLTLAGGVLFGAGRGSVYNWIAETIAALLAFGATRFAASSREVVPMSAGTLFRLRLIPVVPFALLNAGAALSGMSVLAYLVATGAGIIPVTVIYTISAAALAEGAAGSGARALGAALASAALLIGASFVPALIRRAGWTAK